MWIGAAEGAGAGIVWQRLSTSLGTPPTPSPCPGPGACRGAVGNQLRAGFFGSLPGLAAGLTGGALLARKHAPTYGRVALIQSAALFGAMSGALTQLALRWQPYGADWPWSVRTVDNGMQPTTGCIPGDPGKWKCAFSETNVLDLAPGALIGLNVGLAGGLLAAYLPDQSRYGPTWRRVVLVDLAVGAGMIAGATFGCVANAHCLTNPDSSEKERAVLAGSALSGGLVGLVGGVLLTRHVDNRSSDALVRPNAPPPVATFAPMRDAAGRVSPAISALGFF